MSAGNITLCNYLLPTIPNGKIISERAVLPCGAILSTSFAHKITSCLKITRTINSKIGNYFLSVSTTMALLYAFIGIIGYSKFPTWKIIRRFGDVGEKSRVFREYVRGKIASLRQFFLDSSFSGGPRRTGGYIRDKFKKRFVGAFCT